MRPSRMLVTAAALTLSAALSVVPLQVAGAQSPSTSVLVPANGATVSGSQVILDASASAGVTQVYFEVSYLGQFADSSQRHPHHLRMDHVLELYDGAQRHV